MPWNDIDFFTPQLLHHVLYTAALHSHTGANRVNVGIIRCHGDFCTDTGFTGSSHYFDDTFADLRHFGPEKVPYKIRMGSGEHDLWPACFVQYVKDIGADAVSPAIGLPGHLFANRYDSISLPKIDDDIAPVYALGDTVDDLPLTVYEIGIDRVFFSILHLLDDDLLG